MEYEALMLGLQDVINLKIECLTVLGDSELVIKQIRNQCQTKHTKFKSYINEVWDLIENLFFEFNIQFFTKEKNNMVDSLATIANNFKPPQNPLLRYEVEVRHKPLVLENVKC